MKYRTGRLKLSTALLVLDGLALAVLLGAILALVLA